MKYLPSTILLTLVPAMVCADWRTDIGWNDLQEWAEINEVSLPDTSSVVVGQAEAGDSYMINTSSSQFSDITTIINVTNSSSGISSHANTVGSLFFGNSSSLAPDVDEVYMYSANDFISKLQFSANTWPMTVMSHAYISSQTISPSQSEDLTSTLDGNTQYSNVLHIVGANNGASATLPQIWSHSYNSITVGRTDGQHSAGVIQDGYIGAGRQKPEIVNPQGKTSYSTGATASVAALLRALADAHSSPDAIKALTIKSCMLAGANKSKFPFWDNSDSAPIDKIYGAGETNIFNSFRILHEEETTHPKNPNSPIDIGLRGWDYHDSSTSDRVYAFTVPQHASSATLSANLSWERELNRSTGFTSEGEELYIYSYKALENLALTLKDSGDKVIFTSDSEFDNLEHIWQTDLTPGNYTLTVTNHGGSATNYALAWRVDIQTSNSPASVASIDSSNSISFSDLAPNHSHILQRSSNLASWTDVITKTSDGSGAFSHDESNTSLGEKVFYRLRYYSP